MLKLPEWKYLKYNLQHKWSSLIASKGYKSQSYKGDSFIQRLADFRILVLTTPAIKIPLALVCVILVIGISWSILFPGGEEEITDPKTAWFYDINSGELFTAGKTEFPPIEAPSGPLPNGQPAGVIANVLTYDLTGEDPSKQFIGYLETLTENAKQIWIDAIITDSLAEVNWTTGRLVKKVDDEKWVKAGSPEGKKIRRMAYIPNKMGKTPQHVNPE
jgi:hypothetical protein